MGVFALRVQRKREKKLPNVDLYLQIHVPAAGRY